MNFIRLGYHYGEAENLRHKLRKIFPQNDVDLRDPERNRDLLINIGTKEWHQDVCSPDYIPWLLVWSNVNPTEIRDAETLEEFKVDEYEVVAFSNKGCRHRRNQTVKSKEDRWFIRAFLDEPDLFNHLDDIKEELQDV